MGEFNPMKALEPFENAKIEEDMKTRVNSLVVPIVSDGDLPSLRECIERSLNWFYDIQMNNPHDDLWEWQEYSDFIDLNLDVFEILSRSNSPTEEEWGRLLAAIFHLHETWNFVDEVWEGIGGSVSTLKDPYPQQITVTQLKARVCTDLNIEPVVFDRYSYLRLHHFEHPHKR
jgi:hypothetical protein